MKNNKPKGYWSKERVLEEASKHSTCTSFRKNAPGAANAAFKLGIYHLFSSSFNKYNKTYTKEYILSLCRKYKTVKELMIKNKTAYNAISKLGIKKEAYAILERCGSNIMKKAYAIIFGNKYAYVGISTNPQRRLGQHKRQSHFNIYFAKYPYQLLILSDFVSFKKAQVLEVNLCKDFSNKYIMLNVMSGGSLGGVRTKWPKDKCIELSKKFKNRKELCVYSKAMYNSIMEQGINDICFRHMKELKKPSNYWTYKRLLAESKKYKNPSEFKKANPYAYRMLGKMKSL